MMNFPDSPTTGQTYSNYKWDGEKWMPLPATFADAPSDSKIYGRKNATWAEIISDVTKAYVDTEIAKTVKKTGDSMSGALTLSAGGTVPNLTSQNNTNIANTNYVETRAQAWAASYADGRVAKTGDSMSGGLNVAGYINANGGFSLAVNTGCQLYNNGVYYASAAASSIQIQGPPYPTISFHCAGYFGANFGMGTNGQFYMGGWSHGEGVAYQFWTSRDFSNPVINCRFVYVGDYDYGINSGLAEPYGASGCVTGATGFNNTTGGHALRHRQMQVQTPGGWFGVGE